MASDPSPGPLKELATSRARFIAELGERIMNIRQGLARMSSSSDPGAELNAVRRRLHALAAAADVLHFTAAADALGRAEAELSQAAAAPSPAPARERVSRILDLAPSLALGAAIDLQEELDGEHALGAREPLCVLIFGDASLQAAFNKPGPLHGAETHAARDLDELITLLTRLGPDVLLLDGDDASVVEIIPRLRQAAPGHGLPLVAVGNFESYEGMLRLVRRGIARVLPKPVDAAALQRTIQKLAPRELLTTPHSNRFAEGANLVEVVTAEARRAFADPQSGVAAAPGFDADASKHALTALWSAFARIRSLAGRAPDGTNRLPFEGPYGMIPLAPTLTTAFRSSAAPAAPSAVSEALAGRRFVVADSDATLLGALSRSLQRLGASVLPARDGAHALELAERQWPDAVITDAELPSLDGLALCKRLREDVALADVPVALICWKEELLEHARRLSEQHGGDPRPLDPESFAPLAEALGKRVALERRLERHDAVHGRLDGLTPRLLLQLCCSRTPSSLLRVQSGRLTAEIAVVDGRPSHARLLDAGAIAVEGSGALGPFLGMRVGRFSVELLNAALPAHLSGDVMTVLAPAIARARRAHAWLLESGVSTLARIDLEPRVAALYLDEAPAGHKALLARLARGESLRLLIESPEIDRATLTSALMELARRGALLALIDTEGRDALAPDARPASSGRGPRFRDAPAPVMPAAMTLAEAVLQAVSGPGEPDKPSARRTHPGLAPPAPPVPYTPRRGSRTPPLPEPTASAEAARDASSEVAPEPPVESLATEAAEPLAARDDTAPLERDEAEPDATDLDDDVAPPFSAAARVRAVMSPVLVTLAAAGLAFAGMRVIMGGGLERIGAAPSTLLPATAVDDDHSRSLPARSPAPPAPTAQSDADASTETAAPENVAAAPEPSEAAAPPAGGSSQPEPPPAPVDGSASAALDPARPGVPSDVDVSTELLDPLPEPKLRPGHGLLEVSTWQPQRIYVDGVFVGNYERRLIPLAPGTYHLRLVAGDRDIEQPVPIEAGRRTRVSLRTKSN